MMDDTQISNKPPEEKEKKNETFPPGPPVEAKKNPENVDKLSKTEAQNPQGTDEERQSKAATKTSDKSQDTNKSKPKKQNVGKELKEKDKKKIPVPSSDKVITKDTDVKKSQPEEKRQRFKALILSWEVIWDPIAMAGCLTNNNKVTDCSYVALSPPTKDSEWTNSVEQSSIVIFYSDSEKPLYKMGRYLDYCISRKGPEKVIVVIRDADNTGKDSTTKGEQIQFHITPHQFRISKAELDCITRKETLQEMLRKIEEMRKSLISHTGPHQEKPTGSGLSNSGKDMKQVQQKNENKKNHKDNKKKSQPQKESTSINKTQQKLQEMKSSEEIKQTVRIVSWSPDTDSDWLQTLLRAPYFKDPVQEVETINVTTSELERLTEQTSSVTAFVLYFSSESLASFCTQLNDNVKLLSNFDKKKIIGVIDNLDSKTAEKKNTELYNNSPLGDPSRHLFLFWKEEKEVDYLTHLTTGKKAAQEAAETWNKFQDMINRGIVEPDQPQKLGTVGIFSRSANSDYDWLVKLLKSPKLQELVDDVRPFYISNRGHVDFYEEVTRCDFGILYHTKNRGRVNITNVTDSLYDMEIEYLSSALGRYKVWVIIDDLKDSSLTEKERILGSQPDIPNYTRNLILVTQEEKKDKEKLLNKLMEAIMSPALEEPEIPKETYNECNREDDKNKADSDKGAKNLHNENEGKKTDKQNKPDKLKETGIKNGEENTYKPGIEQKATVTLSEKSNGENKKDNSIRGKENFEGNTNTKESNREDDKKKADSDKVAKNLDKETEGKKSDKQIKPGKLKETGIKNGEEKTDKPGTEQEATVTLSEKSNGENKEENSGRGKENFEGNTNTKASSREDDKKKADSDKEAKNLDKENEGKKGDKQIKPGKLKETGIKIGEEKTDKPGIDQEATVTLSEKSNGENKEENSIRGKENFEGNTNKKASSREDDTKKADSDTKAKNLDKENEGKKSDKQNKTDRLKETGIKIGEEKTDKPGIEQKAARTLSEKSNGEKQEENSVRGKENFEGNTNTQESNRKDDKNKAASDKVAKNLDKENEGKKSNKQIKSDKLKETGIKNGEEKTDKQGIQEEATVAL